MPASVDTGFADWLKAGALFVTVQPDNAAAWPGDKGVETEIATPFALRADVLIEGARQAEFLKGPNVKDNVEVPGSRKDLLGKVVTLKGDRLGYTAGGRAAFVVGADELDNGTTILSVIRRLA